MLDVIALNPAIANIFSSLDIDCFGCGGASTKTIEQIAKEQNLSIDLLLERINQLLKK